MINDLTHWFSGFLRRRRRLRHFGRHALLDTLAGRGPTEALPAHFGRDLLLVARDEPRAAIARLKSHEDGLSAREAAASLARSGPNEVAHEKPLPWWLHLWHCYKNPFNLLLPGRLSGARRPGPVRGAGGDDWRVAAGGEIR